MLNLVFQSLRLRIIEVKRTFDWSCQETSLLFVANSLSNFRQVEHILFFQTDGLWNAVLWNTNLFNLKNIKVMSRLVKTEFNANSSRTTHCLLTVAKILHLLFRLWIYRHWVRRPPKDESMTLLPPACHPRVGARFLLRTLQFAPK